MGTVDECPPTCGGVKPSAAAPRELIPVALRFTSYRLSAEPTRSAGLSS